MAVSRSATGAGSGGGTAPASSAPPRRIARTARRPVSSDPLPSPVGATVRSRTTDPPEIPVTRSGQASLSAASGSLPPPPCSRRCRARSRMASARWRSTRRRSSTGTPASGSAVSKTTCSRVPRIAILLVRCSLPQFAAAQPCPSLGREDQTHSPHGARQFGPRAAGDRAEDRTEGRRAEGSPKPQRSETGSAGARDAGGTTGRSRIAPTPGVRPARNEGRNSPPGPDALRRPVVADPVPGRAPPGGDSARNLAEPVGAGGVRTRRVGTGRLGTGRLRTGRLRTGRARLPPNRRWSGSG